jgi:hypothetical protein
MTGDASPFTVMLRESGASSNPRAASEAGAVPNQQRRWLLDRPVKPGDDRAWVV